MSTSSTYAFSALSSEQIITEAYERIGLLPDLITAQQIVAAQRAANFLLAEWLGRGLNLWTVKQEVLSLVPFQNLYSLPEATNDILEASYRVSLRQTGGVPFASSGIAANAFDGNPATSCTQNAPNGFIGYVRASTTPVLQMAGIQSTSTQTYTLVVESSSDNVVWTTALVIPPQSYPAGQIIWAVLSAAPVTGPYVRIRETGGATLSLQELYFNVAQSDIPMTRISRAEYMALPVKNQTGRPTSFYVDRQIYPVVYLWPTPSVGASLFYTRTRLLQDLGTLLNTPEAPVRFLEALTAGIAWKLAVKFAPDRAESLKENYETAYNIATRSDTERVPLRIYGQYHPGGGMA